MSVKAIILIILISILAVGTAVGVFIFLVLASSKTEPVSSGTTTGGSRSCTTINHLPFGKTVTCRGRFEEISGSYGFWASISPSDMVSYDQPDAQFKLAFEMRFEQGNASVSLVDADGPRKSLEMGGGDNFAFEGVVNVNYSDGVAVRVESAEGVKGVRFSSTLKTVNID